MKRKIVCAVSLIAFVFCLMHAVKEEEKVFAYSNYFEANNCTENNELKIENINVPGPDEIVNLMDYSLENMTPIIAQIVRSDLSDEDIQNISQAIIYVETRYLQGYGAPSLKIGDFESSRYESYTNTIYVSKDKTIRNYKDYIKMLLHLSYHSYEYQQIEALKKLQEQCGKEKDYSKLLIFEEICQWEKEAVMYTGCKLECQELWLEKSAEKYALSSCQEYLTAIDNYWGGYKEDIEEVV